MTTLNRIRPLEVRDDLRTLAPQMGLGMPIYCERSTYHVWTFSRARVMLIYEPDEALPWRVQSTTLTTPSAIGSTNPEPERRRCASFDEAVEELGRAHAVTLLIARTRQQVPYPPPYDPEDMYF